jgi:tetratricopeptide (TPR) repeat protein
MRAGQYAAGRTLLGEPDVRHIPHADELWIISEGFGGLSAAQKRDVAFQRFTELVQLESREGQRTAGTAHAIGRMLLVQGRYREARRAIQDGLALAERSAPLRVNAGLAAWRLGLADEARAHWNAALELTPDDLKLYENLIWLALDLGNFEEAERVLARAPLSLDDPGRATRHFLEAAIAAERALRAQVVGDGDSARAQAERVLASLESASALGRVPRNEYGALAQGLLQGDPHAVFGSLARALAADPERWQRLELLLAHMPEDLDAPSSAALRAYLESHFAQIAGQRDVLPE